MEFYFTLHLVSSQFVIIETASSSVVLWILDLLNRNLRIIVPSIHFVRMAVMPSGVA